VNDAESIAIKSSREASDAEWDRACSDCEHATFFHSRAWSEAWRAYSGGAVRPAPVAVELDDRTVAILPLSRRRGRFGAGRVALSSPAGTYGGWISRDRLTVDHARRIADFLIRSSDGLVWRVNPFDPVIAGESFGGRDDATQALELSEGFETLRRRFNRGCKSSIRRAIRERVVVRPAAGLDDWRRYYEVYRRSLERWGDRATSRYGWRLFVELHRRERDGVALWLAESRGAVVAGALMLQTAWHAAYWHGASLAEHFELRPMNLLMSTLIQHACETGRRWFDFGPSGGHQGVAAFKSAFGARTLASPVVSKPSLVGRLWRRVRGESPPPAVRPRSSHP
jgi:CelD/BcsL family acetyltransferase involved in cellulose biosynthesis